MRRKIINCLRLVLGDQLSPSLAGLRDCDIHHDRILMAEVKSEATYVKHHKKKIALLFSAMRHFALGLQEEGYQLIYTRYEDADNAGSLFAEVKRACQRYKIDKVVVTHPGEYRLLQDMLGWQQQLGLEVEIREDDRFLSSLDNFATWAEGRKQLRMEYFYRQMRKSLNLLMDDGQPVGNKWNFDSDNRKPLPAQPSVPKNTTFIPDQITTEVLTLVEKHFAKHFGNLDNFSFAVTRRQALQVLQEFIDHRLVNFGDYQDAMAQGQPWLFHSHISFYLNCGLLLPGEVLDSAEQAYRDGKAPLNAVEGFIRQVLGWREYVRGLYWLKMPAMKEQNYMQAIRALPGFYWHGRSKMNCLSQCISETIDNAYAHHIQRLMILGNFALLAGIHPDEVNEWFLIVYADAYEWVELPNVSGMILFADGGELASKPYAASGAYINKMSNYCQHCHYNVKEKNGAKACPFNYLYWDFLDRNANKLASNPRLAMPYRSLNKMSADKRAVISIDSIIFLSALDLGQEV